MKGKFTYKELSLLIGILVAVIIMITLWLKPFSIETGEVSQKSIQLAVPALKLLLERTAVVIMQFL